MFECVFTNQKTKKSKKWSDGKIEVNGNMLKLFNEEGRMISSSNFVVSDDSLETRTYLIYSDQYNSMCDESVLNASNSMIIPPVEDHKNKVDEGKEDEPVERVSKKVHVQKIEGRDVNDIMNLFR